VGRDPRLPRFLRLLLEHRQGHIVNTASIAALAGHAMLGA
jgi:NAD(P)-dependent dehydrogenase (short-subunit alcohol dehydrogenase family)